MPDTTDTTTPVAPGATSLDRADPKSADPWARLRGATTARIGLGRAGDAMRTHDVLSFQLAHGRARDAVHTPIDFGPIANAIPAETIEVRSQAPDRATYLRRPDLGRRLHPHDRNRLKPGAYDVVFIIGDGLSATGVQKHAAPLLDACLRRLETWSVAPVILAHQARVALGDEIGEMLGARLCAMLIGERPGLSVADSLGVYLTYEPRIGRRDSERNCISNIHPAGLGYIQAADKLVWLMNEARTRRITGVQLKDDVVSVPGSTTRAIE